MTFDPRDALGHRISRPLDTKYEAVTESGCWIWISEINRAGYGIFSKYQNWKRVWKGFAHRYVWEASYGKIPAGMNVLHRCDVPSCVNPNHLFLGTHADNCADKVAKGRHYHGEGHHQSKLNEQQVREIIASDDSIASLAKKYGVTFCPIYCIKKGKTWKHIPREGN